MTIEPFIVKHYSSDERPSIKGNGFDGLEIGEDRAEAEEFVSWLNARLATPSAATREAGPLPKMPTLRSLLHPGYEPGDDRAFGAELVDGEWWHPVYGCGSLQEVVRNARAVLARWGGAAVSATVDRAIPAVVLEERFERWWYDEGSVPPSEGRDWEEHVHHMTRIAWHNGAFVAAGPAADSNDQTTITNNESC